MNLQKRKVSCTFKRENSLEIQERIYQLSRRRVGSHDTLSVSWVFRPFRHSMRLYNTFTGRKPPTEKPTAFTPCRSRHEDEAVAK